jgi:hypothetical protein
MTVGEKELEKKFADNLPREEKRFYSVNFLLARFAPIRGAQTQPGPENYLASRHYGSRDFAVVPFYKNISTPLSRFAAEAAEDE